MKKEAITSDEKAKDAMLDAAKLAEELRNEQEHVARVEHDRKIAEAQIKDLQIKIDDVETGLLIEVWDKGMLWDKAIGYFWTPLQSLQFSAVVRTIFLKNAPPKHNHTKSIF